jgi:methionine-rich copper-binding protein CopC
MFRPVHLVLCAAALAAPAPVMAHAILIDSTPAIRATVPPGSVAFTLHYNSRIDRERSRLTLVAPDKSQTRLAVGTDGPEDTMTTTADVKPGDYTVRWQVLATDGHITRGDVPFTVQAR